MRQPAPTNLKIAQATLPMSVDFAAQVVCFDLNTAGDEIEGSDSQDKTQSREGLSVPDLAGLNWKKTQLCYDKGGDYLSFFPPANCVAT